MYFVINHSVLGVLFDIIHNISKLQVRIGGLEMVEGPL